MFQDKFSALSFAFKTDKQTLNKRLELHLRARDIAEQNIQRELEGLKYGMKVEQPFNLVGKLSCSVICAKNFHLEQFTFCSIFASLSFFSS